MIDMERVTYDLLKEKVPEIKWSAEYPWEFSRCGIITQTENTVRVSSSKMLDHISNVAVQLQVWCKTPEERNAIDCKVNEAMEALGILRSTLNHLADTDKSGKPLYRSVMTYSGAFDNNIKLFYRR